MTDPVVLIADGSAIVDNAPNGIMVYLGGRLEYRGEFIRLLWAGDADEWTWLWSYDLHHSQ